MPYDNPLGDLSTGIFERLSELRMEQDKKDQTRKSEVLGLLGGLVDKVDPGSLPMLLGHIGDTIGLKGKERKFWDSFSGMPDRSIEDQLGTNLRKIMGRVSGPFKAQDIDYGTRPTTSVMTGGASGRKLELGDLMEGAPGGNMIPGTPMELPTQIAPTLPTETARTPGQMYLRDPRAEKLEDLQTQYGLQFQQKEKLLRDKEDLLRERERQDDARDQTNRMAFQQESYRQKSMAALNAKANEILAENPEKPMQQALQEAGYLLAGKSEAELDLLIMKKPLVEAQTRLANFQATQATQGTKPADVMAKRRFDKDMQKEFRTIQDAWTNARAKAKELGPVIKTIEASLNSAVKLYDKTGHARFDPATRSFVGLEPKLAGVIQGDRNIAPLLKQYQEAIQAEGIAKQEMKTRFEQIKTQFPEFINAGQNEWEDIQLKPEFGGVAPAGAPRTVPGSLGAARSSGEPPVAGPSKVGGRTLGIGEQLPRAGVGTTTPIGGRMGQTMQGPPRIDAAGRTGRTAQEAVMNAPSNVGEKSRGFFPSRQLRAGEIITTKSGNYKATPLGKDAKGFMVYEFEKVP